ncbi:MAG: YjbQ family protein [Chloroflexi bacterium]|nr:MAG: YjbQ family protein [Chloroflexota bacterium]MBL1193270.1 YjbQ family protein [Chloroflexota bacterium]NOH10563.1 YjbQ family protein [Chloroflexota bacterium]
MDWYKATLNISSQGKGMYNFTEVVSAQVREWGIEEGMCYLYMQHTSASLVIQESYDPSAKADMQEFMQRLAPENESWYVHTLEGADDSPSHMRAMLTNSDLAIPIDEGRLSLGQWQGIYLFEHRSRPHQRRVLMRGLSTTS